MICKVCGNELGDAKFCTVCGTQVTEQENASVWEDQAPVDAGVAVAAKENPIKKFLNGKNKLLVGGVAIVLVVAIVLGLIFGLQSKEVKIFNALRKTIFNSKSLTIEFDDEWEAKIAFGKGIDATAAEIEAYGQTIEIKDGEVTYENGTSEEISDLLADAQDYLDEYGIDVDLEAEIGKILNGKIDEKEFGKLYDSAIKPALEEAISENFDADVELPTYDKTIKLVKKFLNSLSKDAVTTKKDGKKYKVTVKMADFMVDVVNFCKKNKDVANILKAIDEDAYEDYAEMSKDELKDEMKDDFGSQKLKFEVKIQGGRITEFEADGVKIKIKDINKTKV